MRDGYMVRYAEHLLGKRRLSVADSINVAVTYANVTSSIAVVGLYAEIACDKLKALADAIERSEGGLR